MIKDANHDEIYPLWGQMYTSSRKLAIKRLEDVTRWCAYVSLCRGVSLSAVPKMHARYVYREATCVA